MPLGLPGDNGRNPWNVFGRTAGEADNFSYSTFMKNTGIIWTAGALNSFIAAPYQYLPGMKKIQIGLEGKSDRADLIAFLATLSDERREVVSDPERLLSSLKSWALCWRSPRSAPRLNLARKYQTDNECIRSYSPRSQAEMYDHPSACRMAK
jgi:hypothetical protein